MDVLSVVKCQFLHLAIRSRQPPPVMTDNEKIVVAPPINHDRNSQTIKTAFEILARRLGWTSFDDDRGYIAFPSSDFATEDKAFDYAKNNELQLQWVEWEEVNQVSNFAQVTKKIRWNSTTHGKYCSICYCDVPTRTFVRELSCGHVFHEPCIKDWLHLSETCPLCREHFVKSFAEKGT